MLILMQTDHLDSAGLKAFTTIILRGFAKERATYETLSKQKLPVDNHTELAGPVEDLGNEFEKALAGFLWDPGSEAGAMMTGDQHGAHFCFLLIYIWSILSEIQIHK